jgi:hypothetical protein
VGFAVTASLTLFIGLLAASLGQAGSVSTSAAVKIAPHVLTAGEDGFITVTFVNSGPSTVNHAFATVGQAFLDEEGEVTGTGPLPLPASAFTSFDLPDDCSVVPVSASSSFVTCDFGQVKPGTVRRVISFTAPATVTPFNVHVSVTFDESKGSQLTDTVTSFDPYPFSTAVTTNPAVKGECTLTASELSASNGAQGTTADPPALNTTLFPCTPLTVGVDSVKQPNNMPAASIFGDVSFVDFLGDAGLATVVVSFFDGIPAGVNKNNAELYELAKFPIDLTATNGGAPVPDCVKIGGQLQIPPSSDFISCVLRVDNIPGGGLAFTLLAEGGDDGGWGGIS